MNSMPSPEQLPIAVRAFASKPAKSSRKRSQGGPAKPQPIGFSEWALIFDTETTTDASQQLRLGVYQVRKSGELREAGIFYEPLSLADAELSLVRTFAKEQGFEVRTTQEFVEEAFFLYAYELRGLCIGFNLPFDLSRIAIGHSSARRDMRGGFSLKLSKNRWRPRVQVKHLSSRSALIRFTVPARQRSPRGMRNRGEKVTPRRGHFVDVRTLAGALLGGSWTLGRLSEHLEVEHTKLETEEHGGPLTQEYLEYAVQDVQATWECFERLQRQYESYGLTETQVDRIYSEASLGKGYLKQMKVKPWRGLQLDFPQEILGTIMSTYYGGRSEVHIRRVVAQVLYCDFLSMYPTVCTLMGLWDFVIAERVKWQDATKEVRRFLEDVTLRELRKPETWPKLCALVRVSPDADTLPVRSQYGEESQYTIGLNYLTSEEPLWYTLADVIASKLLTGKTPEVLEAIRFYPASVQQDLESIEIAGNPSYQIDPKEDDFYKRLIDLRSEVKAAKKQAIREGDVARASRLDTEQQALKVTANATSYGIFVELNVSEQDKSQEVMCYGAAGEGFPSRVSNLEEPGRYFHPLPATLITGGARLMLAIAERLVAGLGISWAFCDTDSMALAKPEDMGEADFLERATRVSEWFTPLKPYESKTPLFKLEDANYRIDDARLTDQLEPLYCIAISAKRYVLFNLNDRGRPVLRKASAHGLGHLLAPYKEDQAPSSIPKPIVPLREIGVERWQYDLWYKIVEAALGGTPEQVRLDDLPGFQEPTVSRYAATTPNLLRWFKKYNSSKPYRGQVKPFNFLLAYQPNPITNRHASKPVSTYEQNLSKAAEGCFDRETGESVSPKCLKTYEEALAQYHLHPEAKFHGGDYLDSGVTRRRHILVTATEHIGKEANRWEEQYYLGLDLDAQTGYGLSPEDRERILEDIKQTSGKFGQRKLAEASSTSLSEVSAILCGKRRPTSATLTKLYRAIPQLEREASEEADHVQEVLDAVRNSCQMDGVRAFARRAEVDGANLAKILSGQRRPSRAILAKLDAQLVYL